MEFTGGSANSIDWKVERERIDLAAVVTRLLGPAPGRRGERGRKIWWACPFHQDANPSFAVEPNKAWWKCWGCGEHGDAASFVMRFQNVSFREAVSYLTGGPLPAGRGPSPGPKPSAKRPTPPPVEPDGLSHDAAAALVEESAARLWAPEGKPALEYLTGPDRGLSPETIKALRLGWTPGVQARTRDDRAYVVWGIVIPWRDGGILSVVKVRQPDDRRPKYAEVHRDRRRLVVFPDPDAVRPGQPLVIVEGEFDAALLGERLEGVASVVTFGGAGSRPEPSALRRLLSASPWFIATDGDAAGEKAAALWPASARRVRPPLGKDWCETARHGVDLRRWWIDVVSGVERPQVYTWDDLSTQRWGAAAGEASPGLDARGRFDPELYARAMSGDDDPYVSEERFAIQNEHLDPATD